MSDSNQKSYLRDGTGPRAIDNKSRPSSRRDDDKQRSKHSSSRRLSDSKSSHRREPSSTTKSEAPTFELDVIEQPARAIVFGQMVETSVMVSLSCASPEVAVRYRCLDTSRLMGVVSLIAESRSGEWKPVECGNLTGQKMFDSVHECPDGIANTIAENQPCRPALGYLTFPQLTIRRPGSYRLRVTLIKMGGAGSSGGTTVSSTDSKSIQVVERRSTGSTNNTARRQGR